jgi:DNA-binding transcriptional LysR family regulator
VTLNQLVAFLAAARLKSFTAAANELHVSQASVSELIHRLEQEHGLALFTRGSRSLMLTAAGLELLPFAEQAVSASNNGSQALRALLNVDGGVATFGIMRYADYYFLSDLVEEFHREHPNVRVRLVGQNSVDVAMSVANGEIEAGLVVLPIDIEGLRVTPLLRDEIVYASADPSRLRHAVTISRLAEVPLVLYDAHHGWRAPMRRQIAELAQLEGLRLEPLIEVEYVTAALKLVACGIGDTFLPRAVAESEAMPSSVGFVSFTEPIYDTLALIQRDMSSPSRATQELVLLATKMLLTRRTKVDRSVPLRKLAQD